MPLTHVDQRIGTKGIQLDPAKVVGIVFNDTLLDSPSNVTDPDDETQAIADHLIAFFENEVAARSFTEKLGTFTSRYRFNCKRSINRLQRL